MSSQVAPGGIEPPHADSKPEGRKPDLQGKTARYEGRAPLCAPSPRRALSDARIAVLLDVRVSARRPVADPVARAGTESGGAVAGVAGPAAVEREAAAAGALGEPELEALELGDAVVDPRRPRCRAPRPVAAGRVGE